MIKGFSRKRVPGVAFAMLVLVGTLSADANPDTQTQTKAVTAGTKYRASLLHRWFLGRDYRSLWVTPIQAEILDLAGCAGGLIPVRRVGGMQTLGLAIQGKDGRSFTFRGVDKDPTSFLPASFSDTLAERIMQDQTAAAHPAGTST